MVKLEDGDTVTQSLARSGSVAGTPIYDQDRVPFAEVVEFILDMREGRIAHVALAIIEPSSPIPDRLYVVPWGLVSPEEAGRDFVLKSGREHVLNGPKFDRNQWPDVSAPAWLEQIDHHYHNVKQLPALFTPEECDELIRCYEDHTEAHAVFRDTTFVVTDKLPKRLLDRVLRIAEFTAGAKLVIEVAQVVRWETGSEQRGHWDRARSTTLLTSITNLNVSYVGGRTFIGDSMNSITPLMGKTIFFNGQQCWHGVTRVTAGHRYTLAVWFRRPEEPASSGI